MLKTEVRLIKSPVNPMFVFLSITFLYSFSDKIHGSNFSVFFSDRGVTFSVIGLLFGVMGLVGAITEYPSGIISDVYGRKLTGCIGMLVYGIGLLFFLGAPNYLLIILGASFMGLGMSLFSGTFFAWYKVVVKDDPTMLDKIASKASTVQWITSALAGAIAYFLIKFVNSLTFLVGGLVLIVSAVLIFILLPENYGNKEWGVRRIVANSIKEIISYKIRMLVVVSLLADIGLYIFLVSWQPTWLKLGFSEASLGLVYILLMLAAALGSFITDKLSGKKHPWYWIIIGCLGQFLSFVFLGLSSNVYIIILGFLLFELAIGLRFSGIYGMYFRLIPSEMASSVISGISTLTSMVAFLTASIAGTIIDIYGEKLGFIVGALITGITIILISVNYKRYIKNEVTQG